MRDAVNGPLNSNELHSDARRQIRRVSAHGIAATSPAGIKSYVLSRRSSVIGQTASVASNFAITSNGGLDFSTVIICCR